jgi:hypothetical protein
MEAADFVTSKFCRKPTVKRVKREETKTKKQFLVN